MQTVRTVFSVLSVLGLVAVVVGGGLWLNTTLIAPVSESRSAGHTPPLPPAVAPVIPTASTKGLVAPERRASPGGALYRWRDDAGTVHISSEPPAPDVLARPDLSVYPYERDPSLDRPPPPAPAPTDAPPAPVAPSTITRYLPAEWQHLAKEIEQTLDTLATRPKTLDELSKDL